MINSFKKKKFSLYHPVSFQILIKTNWFMVRYMMYPSSKNSYFDIILTMACIYLYLHSNTPILVFTILTSLFDII